MPLELVTLPCLADNYAYLVHDPASGATAVVDVPEAAPILAALSARGWGLTDIWLTHHHNDHIDGVPALRSATGAKVTGAAADAHRLPPLDTALPDDGTFTFAGQTVETFPVPGHTIGHIAFHIPAAHLAFTGDSLMAAGCGRLFEGTPAQMWASLSRLAALPGETLICSGHEYTTGNLRFAQTLEPANPALISRIERVAGLRRESLPSVPVPLSEECDTNPFLRAHLPGLKSAIGRPDASDVETFAEIRARKDRF
ncbi:hydroxyacylglutathione hydrolase [Fuscovulum ytuae]|uniref:Hydroxyacylglutathione hydrolase n=1 Tax=Fuscovulum ytuae TaxID=3042299 RepID=A0ABY8Q1K1_9RHOB|nr:hydroxyacylglutathione hydrolase [Fuscovulum sp. YMD61]WGV14624.1 hydroxyacylglutathione hydrolase [Fuscovulum sp. YMD61]